MCLLNDACLQRGTFQGEQILPKEWIDYSLTPVSNSDSPGGGKYGAGWWLGGYPSALLPSSHWAESSRKPKCGLPAGLEQRMRRGI